MTNVVKLNNNDTLESLLLDYVEHLTEEEASANIKSMVIVGVDPDGSPFFSVLKSVSRLELVGVLESLKLYLLSDGEE